MYLSRHPNMTVAAMAAEHLEELLTLAAQSSNGYLLSSDPTVGDHQEILALSVFDQDIVNSLASKGFVRSW